MITLQSKRQRDENEPEYRRCLKGIEKDKGGN